jgi:toxin-antitoxin system PIN domain toxin
VILVDANLLIYATMADLPQHTPSRDWLDERLNGSARVGIPWVSFVAFLRVTTNARVFRRPASLADAWRRVETWLDCPVTWIPSPTDRHRGVLAGLMPHAASAPPLVHDADLAALAIEHGLELCSADGDFARFPGLRWTNPLRNRAGL